MSTVATGLAALNSMRSLYEMVNEVRNSNDPERIRAAASQMFDLAFAAREQVAVLADERNAAVMDASTLKTEIEKFNRFDEQSENYTRERNYTGAFVYREKDAAGPNGKSPYFCPHCFGNRKIEMLQPAPGTHTHLGTFDFVCPSCKSRMPLQKPR